MLELQGAELKLQQEVEKPSSFKCATFGASSLKERHLATGNYEGVRQDLGSTSPFIACLPLTHCMLAGAQASCRCGIWNARTRLCTAQPRTAASSTAWTAAGAR